MSSTYIGELCIECGDDVSWGSGKYIDRIEADNGQADGYMCAECQHECCEYCNEWTIDYYFDDDGEIICNECCEKEGL